MKLPSFGTSPTQGWQRERDGVHSEQSSIKIQECLEECHKCPHTEKPTPGDSAKGESSARKTWIWGTGGAAREKQQRGQGSHIGGSQGPSLSLAQALTVL